MVQKKQNEKYMYSPLRHWLVSYLKAMPSKLVDDMNLPNVQSYQVLQVKSQ
jgi:hypothetical protein